MMIPGMRVFSQLNPTGFLSPDPASLHKNPTLCPKIWEFSRFSFPGQRGWKKAGTMTWVSPSFPIHQRTVDVLWDSILCPSAVFQRKTSGINARLEEKRVGMA